LPNASQQGVALAYQFDSFRWTLADDNQTDTILALPSQFAQKSTDISPAPGVARSVCIKSL
jgi:hypothetical protein